MLTTRLWMGAVLIGLTLGMLLGDRFLAPWFPFLFAFVLALSLAACFELVHLLGPHRCPQSPICYLGVSCFALANWLVHSSFSPGPPWSILLGIQAGFLLLIFIYEMVLFTAACRSVERMALTWWVIGYLGLLPSFFAQLRWIDNDLVVGSMSLALAAFVPKIGDIGAYSFGRIFGRHKMTPILSPKKTWEGALGGLSTAVLATIFIDRLGPVPVLQQDLRWEIGFGFSVGLAGMMGDLAESLIKRDCQSKDASGTVPGFGGVLDVVDAILFSAPVSYLWLYHLKTA